MQKDELRKFIKNEIKLLHDRISNFKSNSKIIKQLNQNETLSISQLIELKNLEVENCEIERDNTVSKYEIRLKLKQYEELAKLRVQDIRFIKEKLNNGQLNLENKIQDCNRQIVELSLELKEIEDKVEIIVSYVKELKKIGML
jgi:hypothetical protein